MARLLPDNLSGSEMPKPLPNAPWYSAVLQSDKELELAYKQVQELGLTPHPDYSKNWDHLAALDFILNHTHKNSIILDAGADHKSRILPWLESYEYSKLYGLNPAFGSSFTRGKILYLPGNIEKTSFDNQSFDVITCMSVLEHGVDEELYFRETSRILKSGGYLITSTDYYPTPIPTHGKIAFGVPIRIYSKSDILGFLRTASSCGFELEGDIQFECVEKPIHWKGLEYSFIMFVLRKI